CASDGKAQQTIKQAEAYKDQKIAVAAGDAQRFLSVYEQYKQNKDITERRIYLETMEQLMRNMRKILIEPGAGSGAVPYLPLNELLRQPQATAPAAPSSVENSTGGGARPRTRSVGAPPPSALAPALFS